MNKKILLVIFFALIAVYMFTQLEPSEIKEKFSTIHPITAISLIIIVAYIVIRIKYKKKRTEEDDDETITKETESTKDESSDKE